MEHVRLTGTTVTVLLHLLDEPDRPHYGLDIIRATGLASGTAYPVLARLTNAGWLTAEWEQLDTSQAPRPRRRYYRLTPDAITSAPARIAAHATPTGRQALTRIRRTRPT